MVHLTSPPHSTKVSGGVHGACAPMNTETTPREAHVITQGFSSPSLQLITRVNRRMQTPTEERTGNTGNHSGPTPL